MTSRFQSDPIERRFGQYRQMSSGRFLVGLKDANLSEKIIKIKSLLKEGMNKDNSVKLCENDDDKLEDLLLNVTSMNCTPENTTLSNDSREVAIHIAGYMVKKFKKRLGDCCIVFLTVDSDNFESQDISYIQTFSRGGLKIPSLNLANYVCSAFAMLDFLFGIITESGIPMLKAAESVLMRFLYSFETFTCSVHAHSRKRLANQTVANIFFNKKRKIMTDSVVADHVKHLKNDREIRKANEIILFVI